LPRDDAPAVAPPARGSVTFGSFNNLAKVNDRVADVWARLLAAVPDSRLLLKFYQLGDPPTRERHRARLLAAGIAAERLILEPGLRDWPQHMARYGVVDIALDPFPYNGTTTTCEALWMGVPVVTLAGDRHAGRVGASLLHQVGLDDLVARDADDYVAKAAALARDAARRTTLRATLRARVAGSSLGDAAGFARAVEAAYRTAWRTWCETPGGPS
jgi:predicted O-linked N-acetylglucosamine transferase (SPINDLY family)